MKKTFITLMLSLLILFCYWDYASSESSDSIDVSSIQVGDTIIFGHFPQNFDGQDDTEISWTVYSVSGDTMYLFSDKLLAIHAFDDNDNTNWSKSSLRKWLNGEFLQRAFSKEEQKQLLSIKRVGCSDKVSLMTYEDAAATFNGYTKGLYAEGIQLYINSLMRAEETEYALADAYMRWGYDSEKAKEAIRNKKGNLKAPWWTCSINKKNPDQIMEVSEMYMGFEDSAMAPHAKMGIRPVIRINRKKANYSVVFRNR